MPADPRSAESAFNPAVLPANRISSVQAAPVAVPPATHCHQPRIELIRQDGVIKAIDVTCACGQQTRLLCDYGSTPGAEHASN